MDDDAFLTAFERTTLPGEQWTHAAHVRMAFLTLSRLPYAEALCAIRSGIQRYNASQGNHVGYHETITIAFVRLIADRMRTANTRVWAAFADAHPDLLDAAVLQRHYRRETLFSNAARFAFLEPDLAPLPAAPEATR